jgi:hypothetical protein
MAVKPAMHNTRPPHSPPTFDIAEHSASTPECRAVAAAARAVLNQCDAMVRIVSDAAYVCDSMQIRGGSIGKHLRHTLDHFMAALSPVELAAVEPSGVIDYDRRERNVPMESDRAEAILAIAQIRDSLARAESKSLNVPVRVRVMLDAAGTQAELLSTLGRELAFAAHHAVHHQAMMRTIAAEMGTVLPPEFGKAPSTLQHETVAKHDRPAS